MKIFDLMYIGVGEEVSRCFRQSSKYIIHMFDPAVRYYTLVLGFYIYNRMRSKCMTSAFALSDFVFAGICF